jgi:uncharacterized protein
MLIDLANVTATPKKVEASFKPGEIDLEGESVSLGGNAVFRGETQRVEGKAHIRGTLTADLEAHCSRCLEPVTRHLEIAFDDVFVDASEETAVSETELAERDLDESLVVGGKVDMADVAREQILLAVPEQLYCKDDCKGLCPKCGENRNLIDCSCADDDIDPRWAALKDLRS